MLSFDAPFAVTTASTSTVPLLPAPPPVVAPPAAPAPLRSAEAFLDRLAAGDAAVIDAPLPTATRDAALRFLRQLYMVLPMLPAPRIAAAPDGVVGFTWENRRDHLNAEVFASGHLELFHEDLDTRDLWDVRVTTRLPDELYERAALFCR